MRVDEIMTRDVVTIGVGTTVEEIVRLLTEHRIGGLPVIDDQQRVIGIVTESDLFLKEKGMPFSAVKVPMLFRRWVEPDRITEIYEDARHHTAADVMTSAVICVNVDDTVGHTAWLMAQRNIKRVPVLREGKLAGIVTRADILQLLAKEEE
ncbi:MAG TPA: CBS domain-containing protein [Anaerolineales bacterium]|nr:CBS domain-containing protein [Anaerolineales bacterium]